MPEYRLGHDLDEDPVLRAGYTLDEPLEFEDGEAVVDDQETARDIQRRHTHIHIEGVVDDTETDEPPETEDASETEGADEPAVESPPVDPAELTVDELQDALEDDDYDWTQPALRGLLFAEEDGKNRDTATDAITDRLEG